MAGTLSQFSSSIAILALLLIATLDFTAAQTGVCYGRLGNDLPPESDVVGLFKQNNIQRMRIYNPDPAALQALGGSNIELTVGVANEDLPSIAASQSNADTWVQTNIKSYPGVKFKYIAVGNEISPLRGESSQYVQYVLPAMQNIHNSISSAGLGIRVSTAVDMGLLGTSYPPDAGAFRSDVASYINPVVGFLAKTGAPLLANVYPYFAYVGNKAQIDISYALFTSSSGVPMPGGVTYQNLFYAMVDAMYAALEKSGGSSVEVVVSETGWPSAGGDSTSVDNARVYNTNLLQRVQSGTPKRPGKAIETYIFAMFDENQKSPEYEKNWGIFHPNKELKYPIKF
ncbi:hypothetical protein ABFS82_03G051800 [Erythranthe guttata]|uniref:Glucan endo-1,3-beta-D-glucosidase n=1 Tax=Erythranthe guttata TaxID=4155 RepID=A0A022RYE5_ERYGU|nr:PREDICTED: lichenase-like [Erythranthe guttata]EYU45079.1 hypothetical protein MIMGU_mgv1a009451mg [Erythranthe guttata]|eukprot:XP_012846541.1 PREDICTED: lichenase-like [Erythranthe guttata]